MQGWNDGEGIRMGLCFDLRLIGRVEEGSVPWWQSVMHLLPGYYHLQKPAGSGARHGHESPASTVAYR